MPSVDYTVLPLENGKVQEPTEEQKVAIRKYNAEVSAETLCKAMAIIAVEEKRIKDIMQRYSPKVDGNAVQRDLETFYRRIDDLMLSKQMTEYLASRAMEGLI